MANDEVTTVQISKVSSEKLKLVAESYRRSKTAQTEWLIDQEYNKLAAVKLVPAIPAPFPAEVEMGKSSKKKSAVKA